MTQQNPLSNEPAHTSSLQPHDNVVRLLANNLKNRPRNKPLELDQVDQDFARLAEYKNISATLLAQELAEQFGPTAAPKSPVKGIIANPIFLTVLGLLVVGGIFALIAVTLIVRQRGSHPPNPAPTAEISQHPTRNIPDTPLPQATADGKPQPTIPVVKPDLEITLTPPLLDTVPPNVDIEFTFRVVNRGQAPAQNLVLRAQIPEGTSFVHAEEGVLGNNTFVQWKIGNLDVGSEWSRKLILRVDADHKEDEPIVLANYAVSDAFGTKFGGNPVTLKVQRPVNVPSKLELTISPDQLPADEESTAQITVLVRDQQNQPFANPVNVTFQVQPENGGKIEPKELITQNSQGNATFTAGKNPGAVTIIVEADEIRDQKQITLTQVQPSAKLIRISHLMSDPERDDSKVMIYRIPIGTPLTLLQKIQGEFTLVAVMMWVPKSLIVDINGQKNIGPSANGVQALFGVNPNDAGDLLNASTDRKLQKSISGRSVEVVNENDAQYTQIRIEGWILTANIQPPY